VLPSPEKQISLDKKISDLAHDVPAPVNDDMIIDMFDDLQDKTETKP
jgi:hypothetical protein